MTGQVEFSSAPEGVVRITPSGLVTPLKDGQAIITAQQGAVSASVPVEVTGMAAPIPVSFQRDVVPFFRRRAATRVAAMARLRGRMGSSSVCLDSIRAATIRL